MVDEPVQEKQLFLGWCIECAHMDYGKARRNEVANTFHKTTPSTDTNANKIELVLQTCTFNCEKRHHNYIHVLIIQTLPARFAYK